MTTLIKIKTSIESFMINNDINIISIIVDYLTDECDICDCKCNVSNIEMIECDGCNEEERVCNQCFNDNNCYCCDSYYCENCQEDCGYEFHYCDNKKCDEKDRYCYHCKNKQMFKCDSCDKTQCCIKLFKISSRNYDNDRHCCEDCLEEVFSP